MSPTGAALSDDSGVLDAIQNGIVGLFSSRVLRLVSDWATLDIVLVCCTGLMLQRASGGAGAQSRVMRTLGVVMKGIVLRIVLDATKTKERPVYMTHLLCTFLALHAFDASALGSTAKYIFASQMAQAFAGDHFLGVVFCVALQVNIGVLASMPRLQECAQLVVAQLVVQWFQSGIPQGMEFPTTLLFIHLFAPLVGSGGGSSPGGLLSGIYTFALYQASDGVQLPGRESWVQAAFAGVLWRLAPDPASAMIGQFSCIQAGSQIVLEASGALLRTDPLLAMGLVVTGMSVVLSLTD